MAPAPDNRSSICTCICSADDRSRGLRDSQHTDTLSSVSFQKGQIKQAETNRRARLGERARAALQHNFYWTGPTSSGRAMPAQQLRQVLREGRPRQHHVAAHFVRLLLQVALHVRQESDDRVPFFSLLFSFGIRVRGFALALFRSKMISDGFSSPFCYIWSIRSFRSSRIRPSH